MPIQFFYYLLILRLVQIFRKYRVSQIMFYDNNMFAVYYDERKDLLHYLSLQYTVVYDVDGNQVHMPILKDYEKVNKNWIFLELSGEIKPMSHYSDVILDELVKKVRQSMGG